MRSSLKGDAAACLLMAVVIAYGPQARVGVPAVAAFFAGALLERHSSAPKAEPLFTARPEERAEQWQAFEAHEEDFGGGKTAAPEPAAGAGEEEPEKGAKGGWAVNVLLFASVTGNLVYLVGRSWSRPAPRFPVRRHVAFGEEADGSPPRVAGRRPRRRRTPVA